MKIRIEAPLATLTADLAEEQVAEILGLALDYAVGINNPTARPPVLKNEVAPKPYTPVRAVEKTFPNNDPKKFQGFLYIQCEECGESKGFMPKKPISEYKCNCGHTTALKDMKVARVRCECGKEFKYLTNATVEPITITCINCGTPVDLEYHEKNGEYITMK